MTEAVQLDEAMKDRIARMTPEQRDETLMRLLSATRHQEGDEGRGKIEDAALLLSLRPWVLITEMNPRTGRVNTRKQDRKQWNNGLFDPYRDEDNPDRAQIVKVESVPDGEIVFEREVILGPPTASQPLRVGAASGGNADLIETVAVMQRQLAQLMEENKRLHEQRAVDNEDATPPKSAKAGSRG